MKNKFVKMHGLGNDFAIFDGRLKRLDFSAADIKSMGDRRTGVGFDQMVIIDPPRSKDTDAFLRIYNNDGGEVEACGNATRCIGRLLIDELRKSTILIETKAGKLEAFDKGEKVTVDMGPAMTEWNEIPLSRKMDTLMVQVEEGMLKAPVAVNMGNPHAVFFVNKSELESVPLTDLGPKVEHHPLFPERVNVEVAHVENPSRIRMKVWERGVGITQACGTGACAVAVAGARRGLSDRKVTVVLDGGELDIEWRETDGHVFMTGAVAEVFRGEI
jgi:diaminopimelate epimerase